MNRFWQNSRASARVGGKPALARHLTVTLAIFVLMGCMALSGCSRGSIPGLVRVTGKLTYKGGPWPGKGKINFAPVSSPDNDKLLPAMSLIKEDGSFVAKSADSLGMKPGEYLVAIRCRLEGGTEEKPGKSAIPERYSRPNQSDLKLTVPEGSGPIVQNWDIPAE